MRSTGTSPVAVQLGKTVLIFLLPQICYSTQCVLDLFDKAQLFIDIEAWLSVDQRRDWTSTIFYLVLAIGAQNCPQEKDDIAGQYYNYGSFLVFSITAESLQPYTADIRSYDLMTMYLVGSSQMEAAYMLCGQAIRAAYALGLLRTRLVQRLPDRAGLIR